MKTRDSSLWWAMYADRDFLVYWHLDRCVVLKQLCMPVALCYVSLWWGKGQFYRWPSELLRWHGVIIGFSCHILPCAAVETSLHFFAYLFYHFELSICSSLHDANIWYITFGKMHDFLSGLSIKNNASERFRVQSYWMHKLIESRWCHIAT